jgi:enoyl-CoA hydratase/carnithine racemase
MTTATTAESETKRVLIHRDGAIGWLRIDNARRLNAMSFAMWGDLLSGVGDLAADEDIRVIILAGHSGNAFCAGGDISEFDDLRSTADSKNSYDAAGKAAMTALRDVPKPTIAMIQGFCLGGGLGIALQCDLRIATRTAKLGIPAARRALAYDFKGVAQLVQLVGPANAKDILYTGRQIDGASAAAMGLINRAVADEDVERIVRETAQTIADNAPLSIRASKLMIDMVAMDPADRDLDRCAEAEAVCLDSSDYAEATRAFMEKRKAQFTGR